MANILQHGVKDSSFVDRSAHGQKTKCDSCQSQADTGPGAKTLTRDSEEYMQGYPFQGLLRFAFPLPGTKQYQRGYRRRQFGRTSCMHLSRSINFPG